MLRDIDAILDNIDEPFADSSYIATYAVSKLTKQYVSVALTGDAGDELFAGYNKYLGSYYGNKYNKVPGLLRKTVIEPIAASLTEDKGITQKIKKVIKTAQMDDFEKIVWLMSLGFKQNELEKLFPDIDLNALGFIRRQYDEASTCDNQTKTQYIDFLTVLEGDMLAKVDRASMLASLETRVPMLLDTDVVELAFNIPTKYKIKGRERKIVLKEAFRDLLPKELFSAPKHGFGVPIGKWLTEALQLQLRRYASREFLARSDGMFDTQYINHMIDEHIGKKQIGRVNYRVFSFFRTGMNGVF